MDADGVALVGHTAQDFLPLLAVEVAPHHEKGCLDVPLLEHVQNFNRPFGRAVVKGQVHFLLLRVPRQGVEHELRIQGLIGNFSVWFA